MGNNYTYDKQSEMYNEAYGYWPLNKKQAYKGWRSDPKKWEGWWNNWEPKERDFSVPDYRIYKIDGIPELEYVQSYLAKKGLKDPWLRNEVWRYPPDLQRSVFRPFVEVVIGKNGFGIKWGLIAAAISVACDQLYWEYKYGGKPPYKHDFRDWWHELHTYKPNQ